MKEKQFITVCGLFSIMNIIRWFGNKMAKHESGVSQSGPKYHGLVNQGATCYLNSVLQVLFMTEDFKERVKSYTRKNAGTEHIDRELTDLFSDLEKYNAGTYNITCKLRINNVKEQRDAAEHYEKILRLTSPEASEIFHGELINRSTCKECNTQTESKAGFWHLPLPLVHSDKDYSVEKGLEDFFRPSVISGEDQMYCEKCDEKRDAVLDCEVKHHPEVLVLLLKRFEFDETRMRYVKNSCVVHVPHTLHLPQNQSYELYSFVEHLGEQQFGRYIAKIRSQDDGRWYIFDDSYVSVSGYQYFQLDPTETSQTAYLLFYRKQKAKYHGLVNLGATCYLNSVLQVLFMTEDFRERVKRCSSHTRNNAGTEHIDIELTDLFNDLEKYNAAYTFKIINKLEINNVDEQRDPAELCEKILRLISPEASEIFHGELVNRSTCLNCNTQTESTTRFWHLPLSLVDSNDDYNVNQRIKGLFSRGVQMYCEACDKNCDTVLDCEVKHHPEVLVLLLKRFEFDERHMTYVKINCVVIVPHTLHLPQNQSYELYGFVEHLGGRFIANIRSQDDGRWYIFDDTNVSVSGYQYFQFDPTEKSQTAYLLFYRKKQKAKYHGLVNLGATCYLNSVLQVLFMTEDFRERVKSHTKNNARTEHIDSELSDLFSDLEKYDAYTYKITKKLEINKVDEQKDAAEHYEKILRLTSPGASEIFHGELINRSTCKECNKQTESTTGFWHLPLSMVDSNDDYNVSRSIKDFFSRGVQMYCEACDKNCDTVLDCEVKHHPEVLVLLLKRFEFDERHMTYVKINHAVDVPYTLHIPQSYELYACVEHCGELRCGHYIARIRSTHDGRWYIFDDLTVLGTYNYFQVNPMEKSQTAYLLFYRKQKDTVAGAISKGNAAEASQMEDTSVTEDTQSTMKQEEEEQETVNIKATATSVRTEIEDNSITVAQKKALNETGAKHVDCDKRFEETDEFYVSDSPQQTHDPAMDMLTHSMEALGITQDFHASGQHQGGSERAPQMNSPYRIHYPQTNQHECDWSEDYRRVEKTKEFMKNEKQMQNEKRGTSDEISATSGSEIAHHGQPSEKPVVHDSNVHCARQNRERSRGESHSQGDQIRGGGIESLIVTREGDTEVVRVIPKKKQDNPQLNALHESDDKSRGSRSDTRGSHSNRGRDA